jgi:hypothetical protein
MNWAGHVAAASQEFGESLLGGMYSMSSALAARHAKGVTPEQAAVDAKERVVYFDIFGLVMVGGWVPCHAHMCAAAQQVPYAPEKL